MRGRVILGVLAWLVLTTPARAGAPEDLDAVSSPREAYERGTKAWKAGDKEAAAYWFARADALEPSDRALGAALRAVRGTSLAPLAMALAERASRPGAGKSSKTLASETRAEHAKGAGRVAVRCAPESTCQPKIDDKPPPEGGWLSVGEHDVSWSCTAGTLDRKVSVVAGGEVKVDARCPEPEPAPVVAPPTPTHAPVGTPKPAPRPEPAPRTTPPQHDARGLSPTWVWVGVGVTAVLGGATVWSGLDTKSKHDDFVSGGRRDTALRDDGTSAQTRTNILAVGTGVAALGTLGLALFAVDFGSERELALSPSPDLTGASVRGRF